MNVNYFGSSILIQQKPFNSTNIKLQVILTQVMDNAPSSQAHHLTSLQTLLQTATSLMHRPTNFKRVLFLF